MSDGGTIGIVEEKIPVKHQDFHCLGLPVCSIVGRRLPHVA